MDYCGERGIPHSVFLDGWDPEDRAKAIAWKMERNSRCSMCGTAEWEWDPAQGGDPAAYEALPKRCEGCARKDMARDAMGQDKQPGTHITLIPRAIAEKLAQTRHRRPRSKRELARAERKRGRR